MVSTQGYDRALPGAECVDLDTPAVLMEVGIVKANGVLGGSDVRRTELPLPCAI